MTHTYICYVGGQAAEFEGSMLEAVVFGRRMSLKMSGQVCHFVPVNQEGHSPFLVTYQGFQGFVTFAVPSQDN